MRTIPFILKFTYIQRAEELSCFPGLCQGWCSCAQTDVLYHFRRDGVLCLSSASSPGNHSPGIVGVTAATDHLPASWAACAVWDGPCKVRLPSVGNWAELTQDCLSVMENTQYEILDLEYFNLWVRLQLSFPPGFLSHLLASGESV